MSHHILPAMGSGEEEEEEEARLLLFHGFVAKLLGLTLLGLVLLLWSAFSHI
jgi:uncharacterized membrane protein YqjE